MNAQEERSIIYPKYLELNSGFYLDCNTVCSSLQGRAETEENGKLFSNGLLWINKAGL